MLETKNNVNERMRMRRMQLRIGQKKMAQMCGVTTTTICHVENCITMPKIELAMKIASILHMTCEELFKGVVWRGR